MNVGILCSYRSAEVGGQTTKTIELIEGAKEEFKEVLILNQKDYEKERGMLLLRLIYLAKQSDCILIILASRGYFKILPFLVLAGKIFHCKLYEIVIGGIRYQYVGKNRFRIRLEKNMKKIYVESNYMLEQYRKLGLNQTAYLPNFKEITPLSIQEMKEIEHGFSKISVFKICTFSRIDKYKGVDIAIEIVKNMHQKYGYTNIVLDIFGPVDQNYQEEFEKLIDEMPPYICYKGCIDRENIILILKNYNCLLFPTQWETEGFPGTFIDALAAGLPIIAADKENFRDIIKDEFNGYLIKKNEIDRYEKILSDLIQDSNRVSKMRKNALESSKLYRRDNVLSQIWSEIKSNS